MRTCRWLSFLAWGGMAALSSSGAGLVPPGVADGGGVQLRPGNIHPLARDSALVSAADPALPMARMTLALRMGERPQAQLAQLLADQQNPASPEFHRWLSPEAFGARFGPQAAEVAQVTQWLAAQGFAVDEVARSRLWIHFSGPAAAVEKAFQTPINRYRVNGQDRIANAANPAIPAALAHLVAGPVTLHNLPSRSMMVRINPDYTSAAGAHSLAPGDFATIYNLNPLYAQGIDGRGQSIAIVGRTHPSASNWANFRSTFGLAANPPQVVLNGPDPGDLGAAENGEADLDVEWAGAVARGASIQLVVSASTNSADGVDLSSSYIVNNNLAPVVSVSFGQCESDMGATQRAFYNTLWAQAAAQGMSVVVASGDSGAAGCDDPGTSPANGGFAVNGLASTPYNVAVGGTQFNEGTGSYWNSANGSNLASARSYIPEVAWNQSASSPGGRGLWASGGGQSAYYDKPAWQVAPGVTADGTRDLPDVALSASSHDGYRVVTQGSTSIFSGTSAATPAFAGIMALIVQKTGQRQGNPNPRLYQLGNAQYSTGLPVVFHDITSGNNSVPGTGGFLATVGYDVVTGLGSVDAAALADNWASPAATPPCTYALSPASQSTASGSALLRVALSTGTGCAWTAASNSRWLAVAAGSAGTGSGTVDVLVSASTSTSTRTGSVTIAGLAFQVTQAAINTTTTGPGDDTIAGAPGGVNTVAFSGSYAQYTVTLTPSGGVQVQDKVAARDGTDSLANIQRLQFSDQNLALDLDSANSAGGIYRLYAAALNRVPDAAGLGYWISQADQGQSAAAMAANFVYSSEFQLLYNVTMGDGYGTGLDVSSLVAGFYQNILHRTPDPAGLAYYAGLITARNRSIGQVLAELADSAENHAQVATQIQNGITYLPWHD